MSTVGTSSRGLGYSVLQDVVRLGGADNSATWPPQRVLRCISLEQKNLQHSVHKVNMLSHGCVSQDLENTTGSWDMYGQESDKRYPGMQNEFFMRAGDILRRREALRGFVALGGYRPW